MCVYDDFDIIWVYFDAVIAVCFLYFFADVLVGLASAFDDEDVFEMFLFLIT